MSNQTLCSVLLTSKNVSRAMFPKPTSIMMPQHPEISGKGPAAHRLGLQLVQGGCPGPADACLDPRVSGG